jgi:hypothetical protein
MIVSQSMGIKVAKITEVNLNSLLYLVVPKMNILILVNQNH